VTERRTGDVLADKKKPRALCPRLTGLRRPTAYAQMTNVTTL
jgi:hypothetical protein